MRSLNNNLNELIILFSEVHCKSSQESKRLNKVTKGLSQLNSRNLSKIHIFPEQSSSYSNFRSCIHSDLWENWVIRNFFFIFHSCRRKKYLTKSAYKSYLNFIKNLMDVSQDPEDYPLHKAVLDRNLYKIRQICIGDDYQFFHVFIDQPDPLGNTALMLAVKLRLYDEAQVLIDHGADPKYRVSNSMSCALEVATEMNDATLVSILVTGYHRDLYLHWTENIESFSRALMALDDFSIQMAWECTSHFIPFVKKFTPSDTYKIFKVGNKVKIDLTLVGWEQFKAKRGQVSIVFNGDFNKVLLIDHANETSRELFGDLNYEQIQKHARDLLKNKKYSTDLVFNECNVESCKTWRGYEQTREISGYSCKKHTISCGVSLNIHKRPVLIEQKIKEIKNYEDYKSLITQKNCKSFLISGKVEKSSEKRLKVSSWSSQKFPLKLVDFLPIVELLSSVSQKAKRFSELLSMQNMIQKIGFPLRTKIPIVMTVTALVVFKNLQIDWAGDADFENCLKLSVQNFEIKPMAIPQCSESEEIEEDSVIGPKVHIMPTPQMEYEEIDETFIKNFGIFEEDVKQKIKIFGSHRSIINKVKKFIEKKNEFSNDADITILV